MDIVIDTSALLAVILGQPERDRIVRITAGNALIGPGCIPWEIGNAFSGMFRQRRMALGEAQKGLGIFQTVPIRYVTIDFAHTLQLSQEAKLYAYDAYFLECALRGAAPLLTLDAAMKRAAQSLRIRVLEV